jgi:hypothetical protein
MVKKLIFFSNNWLKVLNLQEVCLGFLGYFELWSGLLESFFDYIW